MMEFISHQLKQILNLNNEPVALLFTDEVAKVTRREFVCRGILNASYGEIITLSKRNTLCEVGNYFIGFSDKPKKEDLKLIKYKIFINMQCVEKFYSQTPKGLKHNSKYVVIQPLKECRDEPELVLFILNPKRVVKLLGLLLYSCALPEKIYTFGPVCQTAIAAPIITGTLSISFIDYGARNECNFKPTDLIVSLPYKDILILIENSKKSIYGKMEVD